MNKPGRPKHKAFAFTDFQRLKSMKELDKVSWNTLALRARLIQPGQELREYQMEAANWVIGREGDLCVIAPTGAGKSLLWMLPLLVQKKGISLVIVPYTSLGHQGEQRCGANIFLCHLLLHMLNIYCT